MPRLENKVVVVTGGSHGIGAATCEALAQEGAKVAITDVADEEGQKLAGRLQADSRDKERAHFWRLDVTDEDAVAQVLGEISETFGQIDVLVNNAGVAGANKPTDEVTLDEWERVIAINVRGVFLCTKHAIPHLRRSCGSIINLSSIYGIISAPDLPPYHASKGAVRSMTKTDALLYAKEGIRVNSVHPGFIWTPLVEELAQNAEEGPEAFRRELDSRHPIGHVGEPADIAHGIVYLASDEAKFVTGSELVIDGGYTAQ